MITLLLYLLRLVLRQNFAGGQVGEPSALIRRQSQLDDHPPAPPASPPPVPLRRPPPDHPDPVALPCQCHRHRLKEGAPMTTTLYLVRHGATAANLACPPRLQGRRHDPPLALE